MCLAAVAVTLPRSGSASTARLQRKLKILPGKIFNRLCGEAAANRLDCRATA